jgi:cytochrome P450
MSKVDCKCFVSFIGDQIIRKGTPVYISLFAIHKDANVFPDPDKFDPERFAENSLISDQHSPFAFIPFSAGSRNCIGK